MLFGCYRKAEANDPEVLTAAIAAVLSEYPADVIEFVTDPRTGLPSTSKWLPSVFDIREACEHRLKMQEIFQRLRESGHVRQSDGSWKKPETV